MANALLPPVNYNVAVPDVNALFGPLQEGVALRQKRQEEQKKNALSAMIGEQIAGGDYRGAATEAFKAGEMNAGIKLTEMSREEKTKAAEMIGRYAALADTPEKWAKTALILAPKFGGQQFLDEYGTMSGRDALIAESLSLKDALSVQEASAKRDEKAGKPPDVININGIDNIWNSQTRRFEPQPGGLTDKDKAQSKSGISVIQRPDGTTETIIGGGGGAGLPKTTEGKIGDKALNAAELGSRLSGIMGDFKPEYQTLVTKAANAGRSWKAWLDPNLLSAGDKQALGDFAKFRTKAFNNFSAYLNELSGAAISPEEAKRLTQSMPNPGTGIFDGDDPVTFKAKLDTVAEEVQRSLARYNFYLRFGGIPDNLEKIPLNNVKQVNGKWYVKDTDGNWYEAGGADQSN